MVNTKSGLALKVAAAAVAAATANFGVSAVAQALTHVRDFAPLRPVSFVPLTVIGVIVGAVGWAVIRRRAKRPGETLRWVVPVAVAASFVPDLLLYAGAHVGFTPILALMIMHVLVAVVAVPVYAHVLPVYRGARVDPGTAESAVAA